MSLFNLLKKFSLISIAIFMIACGNDNENSEKQVEESSANQISVLATTPLLGEYVKQVAGDNINVDVLMPYSADPHHFEPSPQDVTKIESADLVFYVGLKYETAPLLKLLKNSSSSKQVLIEIGDKIDPIEFKEDDHDEHEGHGHDEDKDEHGKDEHEGHGHEGHNHGVYDPHFWFDPTRVALAVDAIKTELINIDPENKDSYETSANNYKEKLTDLDMEIKNLVATIPSNQRIFITTHEALSYLEARYDLEVKATIIPNITTDDTTTPKRLVEVIEEIKEHEIKVLFMESETPTKAAEVIAQETGITLVSGLWVETLQEGQSYVDFMKSNINIIVENLKV